MRLALYQPDNPRNTGALIRLCACLGVTLEIIEPAGFTYNLRELKRTALDYAPLAEIRRHQSWRAFSAARADAPGRLILLTTQAEQAYTDFAFAPDDTLLLGQESAGAPEEVHQAVDARLRIPLRPQARSLNLATAAAMALGEALRQTDGWPG